MQERPPMEREAYEREPRTTGEARRAITETRSRISQDLDAIEDRIVEKREQLKSRVDVLTPARRRIRDRVWPSLGIALGAGFALGLLGGEEDEAEPSDEHEREQRRRWRAERRERLRERRQEAAERRRAPSRGGFGPSKTAMLGGAVTSGLTARMKRVGRELFAGRR